MAAYIFDREQTLDESRADTYTQGALGVMTSYNRIGLTYLSLIFLGVSTIFTSGAAFIGNPEKELDSFKAKPMGISSPTGFCF